ncbi:MAG: hypothetical protein HPY54_10770 [Chthonomonadetes bacterium]|nr:hypothetical protein [Chthonomonadetes bacterium]
MGSWWHRIAERLKRWREYQRGLPQKEITLYTRQRGAVCYAAYLFGYTVPMDQVPDQLLTSGLTWYWQSKRDREARPEFSFLPATTPITLLTEQTKQRLLQELQEVDVDDYGRSFVFYGCFSESPVEPDEVKEAAVQFLENESGCIQLMIIIIGDDDKSYLFVPREPIEPARRLLMEWNILRHGDYRVASFDYAERVLDYWFKIT